MTRCPKCNKETIQLYGKCGLISEYCFNPGCVNYGKNKDVTLRNIQLSITRGVYTKTCN